MHAGVARRVPLRVVIGPMFGRCVEQHATRDEA